MNTAATASNNISNNVRDTVSDAREGAREVGKAAADASGTIENDLKTLRDDFGRLASQVGDIMSSQGNAAWRRAKSGMDGVVSDAQDKGREAVGAVRDVSDNFIDAIDDSIKNRPYTTLALAAGLAFVFGATWRR